ncbi:hypothetical protein XELAEV_18036505mg [Xenopus laevis]|uniref:Uncharacterized protein n=1 Tax=Xenopus laevis TaxID=8355 RepID=A0A974CI10_XENLA|nr:hypothetical protein XELAEV_18036505mg [Xenopus laevis]
MQIPCRSHVIPAPTAKSLTRPAAPPVTLPFTLTLGAPTNFLPTHFIYTPIILSSPISLIHMCVPPYPS